MRLPAQASTGINMTPVEEVVTGTRATFPSHVPRIVHVVPSASTALRDGLRPPLTPPLADASQHP